MSMQRCCPPPPELIGTDFTLGAALLRAAADPARLLILSWLGRSEDEICVCDFTDALPLNQPTVSHHLKILRDAGLVTCDRRGTWVYYRLAPDARQQLAAVIDAALPGPTA
ncbi:MAG TPA: metalloregulator ArsR/SmtB family transcription factor [Candidatus Baltobacteraceae bacterium]